MFQGPETKRKKLSMQAAFTAQDAVTQQVPQNRSEEIMRYLSLFGYKPDRTILQVHRAAFFGRRFPRPKEMAARARAIRRYGGTTFIVVGRTHDVSLVKRLIPPKKEQEGMISGYLGYLFGPKDERKKAPHEILPLDFTPNGLDYPRDWKGLFGPASFLITMHVPSDFARKKNELMRQLRKIKGAVNVKDSWKFVDELQDYGYEKSKETKDSTA